jgi:modulator of FtsH protease HflK
LEHFGRPAAAPLDAGAHVKWPWPADRVYRFRTDQIQSLYVGYTPDTNRDAAPAVLWTVAHNQERNFLVAYHPPETVASADDGTNGEAKARSVGLITISIPVQFQITNVMDWVYRNTTPQELLQTLADRAVARYLAGVDLNEILSHGRTAAAETLLREIQAAANRHGLGVKILFVGLQDIHPPTTSEVAATYEKVIGAEEARQSSNLLAQAEAIRTNALAGAQAFIATNRAEAERVRVVVAAQSRAGLFTNQIPAYAAAPAVYRQRLYLQNFAEATRGARKYVLLVTNTDNVYFFDLEDKIRDDLMNLTVPTNPH